MERTIHILLISQTLYGPYGLYRSTCQRVWIVRSIYSSIYQNIWTVRSMFSSTCQKTWIVRSIYGSTFEKNIENLENLKFHRKNPKFSNGHIYSFHASKIQILAKIRIYRKSNKKVKNWPRAT